jgi:hypothetical protein
MVKIRVKERIEAGGGVHRKSNRPERVLLVILGACLGLGLGYLVAGWLAGHLKPPLSMVKVASTGPAVREGMGNTPRPTTPVDIDFDLPPQEK